MLSDVAGALPSLAAAGGAATFAWKSPELLKEIYGDLAKPGVTQVGKALADILGLGNTILIPLRLLNETARNFECRSFERIAERFSRLPEEDVVPPAPEIAVPVLEALAHTEDELLRNLFIELLAMASDGRHVSKAHPSFTNVITNLSPDEAKLIRHLDGKFFPSLTVEIVAEDNGRKSHWDFVLSIPDDMNFKSAESIEMYISNLSGLGIISIHDDRTLKAEGVYDNLVNYVKNEFTEIKELDIFDIKRKELKVGEFIYRKNLIELTSYGRAFRECCVGAVNENR